jgi:hypothetical protein
MIQLSNRTFPMLQTFAHEGSDYYMSVDEAQRFDQRPFRAMLVRGYVAYRPGRGFHITREGRQAAKDFLNTSIDRNEARFSAPLTSYFDPVAYGLPVAGRKARADRKPARRKAKTPGSVRDLMNGKTQFQYTA